MKNKLIKIISGIIIVAVIFIVFLKLNLVSTITINMPTLTEVFAEHTYKIYKVWGKNYICVKRNVTGWLGDVSSDRVSDLGILNNKEDFSKIEEEINLVKKEYGEFTGDDSIWKRHVEIKYKNEELDSVEELIEKLF